MSANQQIETLSALLQLEKSFRNAKSPTELAYLLVNDLRVLINFQQAALWNTNIEQIVALSDIAIVDNNVPYCVYLKKLLKQQSLNISIKVQTIDTKNLDDSIFSEWKEWLPENGLWIPLIAYNESAQAGFFLARKSSWSDHEIYLLEHISETFGHAWQALNPKKKSWYTFFLSQKSLLAILLVIISGLFIPVKMSALAPATVIPFNPTILTASLDGVIDDFYIQPNDNVEKNTLLVKLEDKTLKNKLQIALKKLAVIQTEYHTTAQKAMFDVESKALVNILKSRINQQQAEVNNMQDWLKRIEIIAPHSGIVIFSDVNDWIGKPVITGEKILMLANPSEVELEIQLPITDTIKLTPSSSVLLFLNIDPLKPIKAKLSFISYQAEVNSEDQLAYRLKARFETKTDLPRIGLKGTAKIYGEDVPLAYYLFRKPLASLRQWIGL